MAAKAAFSQAPGAPSGPDGENPNDGENTNSSNDGIPNPRPMNPGLHGAGQDLGATHPHLISAAPRPLFYFQAPPPPPFLPYQWPMPFYNPFSSFPGYGMMMPPFGPPPFNPPPYMEAPAYILPHPPVQPVDYRRVVHPHPNAASYQNPIQTRRSRLPPPQTTQIRQTVSSEVQTDPTPRSRRRGLTAGSPLRSCSDSGRETVLTSPTSSTSSNQMKLSDGEGYNRSEGLQLHISCMTSAVKPHPAERETTQKPLGKENCPIVLPSLKKFHSNSHLEQNCPETEAPVKPSEKERRLSVPDILMSWTPQKDEMAAEKTGNLSLYEDEMEPVKYKTPTVINKEQLEAQSVDEKESDKEETEEMVDSKMNDRYEHSLNISIKLLNHTRDEETPEQPTESSCSQISSSQFKRKLNESVWSVESLPVFIPTKEWLMQNVTSSGPEVILETAEEAENAAENNEVMKERKKSRSSSTDSVQMSDSFLGFSTPNKTDAQQMDSSKIRKNVTPLNSPTSKQSNLTATVTKALDINESEPGGNSPNRRSFTIDKERETGPVSKKGQPLHLECENPSSVGQGTGDCGNKQLSVPQPINGLMEVSPSKRHLVDCGVQCPELQENMETATNTRCFNSSDLPNTSYGKPEGYGMNKNGQKKRHGHWRNKGQDRPQSHQEALDSYCGKAGKPRGGRNRY